VDTKADDLRAKKIMLIRLFLNSSSCNDTVNNIDCTELNESVIKSNEV